MVDFCPKCGSLLVPKREAGKTVLACPKCGYVKETTASSSKNPKTMISKKVVHSERDKTYVISSEEVARTLPKVKGVLCRKCGNDEAYYMIMQTRRADEPPTRFYKCTKCGYTWREYE
ncbi:MAG: transcription factor S [Zestosphaera tikiterensis]|uniref:Transcription factor S n=1 Tax=Zestosphaera tikiterensis TaxID=1973259 RepID=A0A2R7Y3Z0_9CREN|nr:MAG: transcription factor S [Zestosphaera tikiterensis]